MRYHWLLAVSLVIIAVELGIILALPPSGRKPAAQSSDIPTARTGVPAAVRGPSPVSENVIPLAPPSPQTVQPESPAPATRAVPHPIVATQLPRRPKPLVAAHRRLQRFEAPKPAPERGSMPVSETAMLAASAGAQRRFDSLMQQGYGLYRKGWYGPAMGRFRQAALLMPSSVSAYLWMGRSAFKVGYYQEARQVLDRVIAVAPASEAAKEARALLTAMK